MAFVTSPFRGAAASHCVSHLIRLVLHGRWIGNTREKSRPHAFKLCPPPGLLPLCVYYSVYAESERETTHCLSPIPPWVVSGALRFFKVCVGLRCAFDFPQIGLVLPWLRMGLWGMSPGDVVSRRSCVCRALFFSVYVCLFYVFDLPRIGFCFVVGPKGSVQGRWGGVVACCAGAGVTNQRVDHSSSHIFVSSF